LGASSVLKSNDLDISDTASSTAALSMSLPVETRLKQYAERHEALSLSLSADQADLFRHYLSEVENNQTRQYNELNDEEAGVLSVLLSKMVGAEQKEVYELVGKELGMSVRDSVVVRISENIIRFLGI
jgi:hypothetical protein